MLALLALIAGTAAPTAVAAVTNRRPVAPLVRGSLENACVAAAAAVGAAGMLAQMLLAGWLLPEGEVVALATAPVVAAAVPWVAGEMLSGPSVFRGESLIGAVAAAQLLGWAAWFATERPFVAVAASMLAAAGAYLETRGPPAVESPIYGS